MEVVPLDSEGVVADVAAGLVIGLVERKPHAVLGVATGRPHGPASRR